MLDKWVHIRYIRLFWA